MTNELIKYCKDNDYESAKKLLKDPSIQVSTYSNKALKFAINNNNLNLVKLLLVNSNFKETSNYINFLKYTLRNNNIELFKMLFNSDKFVKTRIRISDVAKYATKTNNVEVFKLILKRYSYNDLEHIAYELLDLAITHKSYNIISYIFNTRNILNNTEVVNRILQINDNNIIESFLDAMSFEDIDIEKYMIIIQYSIKFGNTQLFNKLHNYIHKFDYYLNRQLHQYRYNTLLLDPIRYKYNEILKVLLSDNRIINVVNIHSIIELSIRYDNIELLHFIGKSCISNKDLRNDYYSYTFKMSVKYKKFELIDYVLNEKGLDLSDSISNVLASSASNVELFLKLFNNESIRKSIVKLNYTKLPKALKMFLVGKFNVKNEQELKQIINIL